MKNQTLRNSTLSVVLIPILISLSCSCQKESAVSLGSLYLGSSSYGLKNAYYSNNWGSGTYMGGELILTGPTIRYDNPTGFFNSTGSSAFVVIINSGLGQLTPGEYQLDPIQTMIYNDASPKPTDTFKEAPIPVGDLIDGKMKISNSVSGALEIEITGYCYVNKIRSELKISFNGTVGKISEPYHLAN